MKIRQGFVSNSSSSSFCIYGTELESDDLVNAAKTLNIKFDEDDFNEYDIGESIADMTNLEYHSISGEYFYLGRSYTSIEDDETGKQFRDSVRQSFEKIGLGAKMLGIIDETYMD
jgi:hypothetical protein